MSLDAKIPKGPLAEKWSTHKFNLKLVNPANKRKYDVIVVGTGLAGASAAAAASVAAAKANRAKDTETEGTVAEAQPKAPKQRKPPASRRKASA